MKKVWRKKHTRHVAFKLWREEGFVEGNITAASTEKRGGD